MKKELFSGALSGISLAICIVLTVTAFVLSQHVRYLKGELSFYQALQQRPASPEAPAASDTPVICPKCECISTPAQPCYLVSEAPGTNVSMSEGVYLPAQRVLEPSTAFSLERASFSDLPGWTKDNFVGVETALKRSCEKIVERPPSKIGESDSWKKTCEQILGQKVTKPLFEKLFVPYKVKAGPTDMGTFTGYYTAELKGSYTKNKRYTVPIYAPPQDLLEINLSPYVKNCAPCRVVGRVNGNTFEPYLTRAEITKSARNDNVLLWVDDAVDAFLLHIQGSGVVSFEDGTKITVGFANHNGHNFVGIGSLLLKEGLLKKGSMTDVRTYLKQNPKKASDMMMRNPRYIFFRTLESATGAQGVPLTAGRSLAVDPTYIPLGIPLWLDTRDGDNNVIQRLVIAQDTGAAIKGPIRGDFFWGTGEEAFQRAGKMKSKGSYYVFIPK